MPEQPDYRRVSNPLTMIAIFAGLAEVAGTVVLPAVDAAIQTTLVWYVMGFPVFLVVLFFLTLNFNHRVLYAPSDFRDERLFMESLRGDYSETADAERALRGFWKPDGKIDRANEAKLKRWLRDRGFDEDSLTFFLRNDLFGEARRQAVRDLGIAGSGG